MSSNQQAISKALEKRITHYLMPRTVICRMDLWKHRLSVSFSDTDPSWTQGAWHQENSLTIAHNDAIIMQQNYGGDCMPKIIPIRDLRDTGRMSQMCSESREPIFITKNGYGDMVIMSMAVYEESLARLEMRIRAREAGFFQCVKYCHDCFTPSHVVRRSLPRLSPLDSPILRPA